MQIAGPRRIFVSVATAAATAAALGVVGPPATSAPTATVKSTGDRAESPLKSSQEVRERKGFYDARQATSAASLRQASALSDSDFARLNKLSNALGPRARIALDPLTATPENLAVEGGYLTGRSSAPAARIVMNYVRGRSADLGLRAADVSTFRLRSNYADSFGIRHLAWEQYHNGVPVFGNGLKAHVLSDGRILSLQGAPVGNLAGAAAKAPSSAALSAAAARSTAAEDVGGTVQDASSDADRSSAARWSNGDQAKLVWFLTPGGLRLAWSTYTQAGDSLSYSHVIDADSGAVLYRRDLVDHADGDALVYDYHPGARRGGTARTVNFYDRGWLRRGKPWLHGKFVKAWADLNDDDLANANERTPVPGTRRRAQFPLDRFHTNELCTARFVCTWAPNRAYSWRANKNADVTNAFYLASNFHDYLERRPIGFTARSGNFESADGDPILLNALDGANTADGYPDGNHIDNANMNTPPDGIPPTMQMYLFHAPGATNEEDPFLPTSSSFDASVLYHEYVHGLSNRLVVDASGNSTLNSIQAGSMGEAWSDYYAEDYLVHKGFKPDSVRRDGQVLVGEYVSAGKKLIRNLPLDCDRSSRNRRCTDVLGGYGYHYGEFSTVPFGPEVHSSGEIWAQTLWDMRETFGHRVTAALTTQGMRLSVNDPSFLDMRNAILQADQAMYDNRHTAKLWKVFARRGMGWYAGTLDGGDTQPGADFHTRPPARRGSTLAGYVTDPVTDRPLANALVVITGHDGTLGNYTARTNSNGIYQIDNVLPGRYKKVVATKRGYEIVAKRVLVSDSGFTQRDFEIRRDWAASTGGGRIVDFNGPDYSPQCGPEGAIDLSQGTGWGSTTGDDAGNPTGNAVPKYIVVALPRAIDIAAGRGDAGTAFRVDPSNTCGDPGSSSTNKYRIDVSTNGNTWVRAQRGSFGTVDDADTRGRYFNVASDRDVPGVRFVRFWMLEPQVPDFSTNCPDGPFGGCVFMDMTELLVFGEAAR